MAYYSKEIPSGSIDGSNKVFTTAYTIAQIDDLFVDGAIYLGSVSVTGGNVITLADAPQATIFIDYYDAPPVSPVIDTPGFISVQTAYDSLLALKKDLSDVPQATFIQWCDFINKFLYRFILGSDPGRFLKEYQFTSAPSVTTYALPTDFRDVAHFGSGIFYWDANNDVPSNMMLARTGYGATQTGYFIQGTNLRLTPHTWNSDQQFVLRYCPVNETIQYMGDYFSLDRTASSSAIIPSEFLDMLVNVLDVRYSMWDEVPDQESLADARYSRTLTEFAKEICKEAGQYFVEDVSVYYQ